MASLLRPENENKKQYIIMSPYLFNRFNGQAEYRSELTEPSKSCFAITFSNFLVAGRTRGVVSK